jgi:hypothetical protein
MTHVETIRHTPFQSTQCYDVLINQTQTNRRPRRSDIGVSNSVLVDVKIPSRAGYALGAGAAIANLHCSSLSISLLAL